MTHATTIGGGTQAGGFPVSGPPTLCRTGRAAGPNAAVLLNPANPSLDFAAMATGIGVSARPAGTAEEFTAALVEPGAHLIGAVIPRLIQPTTGFRCDSDRDDLAASDEIVQVFEVLKECLHG